MTDNKLNQNVNKLQLNKNISKLSLENVSFFFFTKTPVCFHWTEMSISYH